MLLFLVFNLRRSFIFRDLFFLSLEPHKSVVIHVKDYIPISVYSFDIYLPNHFNQSILIFVPRLTFYS